MEIHITLTSDGPDYMGFIATSTGRPSKLAEAIRGAFGSTHILWRREPEWVPQEREFDTMTVKPGYSRCRFVVERWKGPPKNETKISEAPITTIGELRMIPKAPAPAFGEEGS